MVTSFDRITIAVPDLQAASAQYGRLLDVEPLPQGGISGEPPTSWLGLPNTVIELRQDDTLQAPAVRGIVFGDVMAKRSVEQVTNSLALDLGLCNGAATAEYRDGPLGTAEPRLRVDHLVLHTDSAEQCIELFGKQLGIRLALDKTVPEWGGRMLFFRAGKLTLEVIESSRKKVEVSYFWGIAYQCQDIEQTARHLAGRGIELSAVREGRKPGTRVATIKSHCLGIPTLLIEPAAISR